MSVLTEAALRVLLKDEDLSVLKEYRVDGDTIVTPSARAWLTDNKIDLYIGDKRVIKNPAQTKEQQPEAPPSPAFEKPARYRLPGGGYFDEKPEHMTALHGNILVEKDHRRIRLRGKLDSLQARILEAGLALRRLQMEKAVADLEEVRAYVAQILRCEVLDEPLSPMRLLDMGEDEIRSRSHTPKKYYGIPHFITSLEDGEAVILLNSLRAEVREVELIAYAAFKNEDGEPERGDILMALNRLSSVFYVMMLRAKAKEYTS